VIGILVHKLKEESPLVSVIIPTFNSERFLEKCICSLESQTCERLEIMVVDDSSKDSTVEIAERHNCRVVKNPRRGRAEAKNEGIRRSCGEYLFFVDSDMELTPDVINECVDLAENDKLVGGIVIPERSVGNSFWVKVRDFERSFYAGSVVESARFFPAKLVKEVGGFEEGLIFFEESTLPFKIQRRGHNVFVRAKSLILHYEEDFSLVMWLRKKFYYGKTVQAYGNKYGDYSRMQTSVWFRFGLFAKSWRRFLSRPELALGVIGLKSLEYLAVVMGRVSSKLS
jgi:glycosyltransferase involved in cell wall biosynthesis